MTHIIDYVGSNNIVESKYHGGFYIKGGKDGQFIY